jgi:acetylglutamate kinase
MQTVSVIKISGNIIDEETRLHDFLKEFSAVPGKKILVHGGGKLATRLAEVMGVKQQMVDGRRITDAETLKIVTMVYAGYINKNIVACLQSLGCSAVGMSGADGNLIKAHKRQHASIDYGFVGDVDTVNTDLLSQLLEQNHAVVVAPITHDGNGALLNTNADTIAQEIAKALAAKYNTTLVYSFEKAGVLLDVNDESSVILSITPGYYEALKSEQKIFAGMLPKLDNAFAALGSGVSRVIIGKAEELSALLSGTAGTTLQYE